jgi:hypothetical protein
MSSIAHLFMIALSTSGHLCFKLDLGVFPSLWRMSLEFWKEFYWICGLFWYYRTFTIFILLTHEYGRSFLLIVSCSTLFFNVLQFLL